MVRDTNGRAPSTAPASATSGVIDHGFQGSNFSIGGGLTVLRVDTPSIVNPQTVQSIEHSFVVLETRAIFGMELLQIADYAAMRGLAITASTLPAGEDSILTLFAAGAEGAPRRLTAVDRGYLAGLYRAPANRTAAAQGNAIVRSIQRESGERAR